MSFDISDGLRNAFKSKNSESRETVKQVLAFLLRNM